MLLMNLLGKQRFPPFCSAPSTNDQQHLMDLTLSKTAITDSNLMLLEVSENMLKSFADNKYDPTLTINYEQKQ